MAILIVLNYNDSETTLKFLQQIKSYACFEHIVIVDNCSTDDSYEQLEKEAAGHIVLLRTDSNRGYASGNNFGIQYAIQHFDPEYIVVANPDVKFSEDTVNALLESASKAERLGVITCIMQCTSNIKLPIAWRLPGYKDCLMENLILLKYILRFHLEYPSDYYDRDVVEVDAVPGSFFLLEPRAFRKIGGFDEGTFLYYEENILAYRLKALGYRNYLLTTQNYVHDHSVSINKSIASVAKRLKLSFASRKYFCKKYLGIGKIKELLLDITFVIGLMDYRLISSIRRVFR